MLSLGRCRMLQERLHAFQGSLVFYQTKEFRRLQINWMGYLFRWNKLFR